MYIKGKTVKTIVSAFLVGASLLTAIPAQAVDYIGIGKVTGDAVNIRDAAGLNSNVIGCEPFGTNLPAFAAENGWYKISYNNQTAWICGSYFEVSPVTEENSRGSVTGDYVNVRSGAGLDYSVITTVAQGTTLMVYGEENGWYKVSVNGTIGYISSDYFVNQMVVTAVTSDGGQAVVDEAMRHLGKAYVYGATGPNAFDCSGFTSYVYRQMGYSINRTAAAQFNNGTPVQKSNLAPGDLVFFAANGSNISHVGIYIGNGQMIHASTSTTGVIVSDLNSAYYTQRYVGARRIVK